MRKHFGPASAVTCGLLLLLAVYVGAYRFIFFRDYLVPDYHPGAGVIRVAFWPANQLDRALRPAYWKFMEDAYPP